MKSSDNTEALEDLIDESLSQDNEILSDEKSKANENFYANLAEKLPESTLKRLSSYLLEALKQDEAARKEWLDVGEKVKKYLGFSLEEVEEGEETPFNRTFDTTLPTAAIRGYSVIRAELLPEGGPAGYKINGSTTPEKEERATRNREWMNYYLTVQDSAYYPDSEKCIMNVIVLGSGFKKTYYDSLQKRQISRFILPKDFLVDGDCTSILESNRLTHILHLSKREIILNQQHGIYRDVELPYLVTAEDPEDSGEGKPKIKEELDTSKYPKNSLFTIYETHAYLNLNDFKQDSNNDKTASEVPLPYIITLDEISKEVLSIRRNWHPDDETKSREEYFVQYNYLPGFGIYGIGLAHMMGSNAITLTKILRQLVDAGSYQNLQGGLRSKMGAGKNLDNNLNIAPGQWIEVDTGQLPLRDYLMPLPYTGPSMALRELRQEIIAGCKELCSSAEMGMLEGRDGISTATTLAILEQNNRIQSAVLRSFHASLSRELQLLNKLFKKTLEPTNFNFGGKEHEISPDDFIDDVTIVPVADPSMGSRIQRLAQAQAILQTASQAPEMHNMHEIFKMVYEAQGLSEEDIKRVLQAPQEGEEGIPMDPATENVNMTLGKPVKAEIWQDNDAHILVHGKYAQENPDNPALQAEIMDHIQFHKVLKYLLQVQQMLGMELPPMEELKNPEVQNRIALSLAQAMAQQPDPEQPEAPLDPMAVQLEEIRARERIAAQNAETGIFKAQLDFEKEKMKIQAEKELAAMKAETELTKQEITNGF